MFRVFVLFLSLALSQGLWAAQLLPFVYLTFENEDTSTSVTINFMTEGESRSSFAYVSTEPEEGLEFLFTDKVNSRIGHIKKVDKTYHHVKVENLRPQTTYYFTVGDSEIGYSSQYKFKTLSSDDSTIKVLAGGDMGTGTDITEASQFAVQQYPNVILIGGDLAYANAKVKNEGKWMEWFEQMNNVMFTPDGYLIPLIVAIGNHETSLPVPAFAKAPFYFELFPQSKSSHFVRKLGANTALIVLDSGHYETHSSQRGFIEEQLSRYQSLPHRVALYHAPLYPNNRGPDDVLAREGRKQWLDLFDKYNLTTAFEHHDHTFKRTKVLRADKVSTKGTVYVGDGCWGKDGRESKNHWYLEKASSATHVWSATINKSDIEFTASGLNSEIHDHFRLSNIQNDETWVEELL